MKRPMIRTRKAALSIATLAVAMTAASCGTSPSASTLAVPEVFNLNVDPAAGIAQVDPTRSNLLPADKLRGVLEKALTWHGITLVEVMRAARRDDASAQVWIAELVKNTADLTADIGLVYGPDAARAFNQQWAQHTQFLVDYAVAVGHHDTHAAAKAKADLQDYATDSGSFFETATDGGLPASLVQQLLSTHIQHMYSMLDADQAGDLDGSVGFATTDGAYLATIANGLSTAIAAQRPTVFTGSTSTPTSEFCTIVTTKTAGYLEGLLMTGNAGDPAVRTADSALALATSTQSSTVVGFATLPPGGPALLAQTTRTGLDHAIAYALANTPPKNAAAVTTTP